MDTYRERPGLVEAYRWIEGEGQGRSLAAWCGGKFHAGRLDAHGGELKSAYIAIPSRGSAVFIFPGDWVVLRDSEFYPLKHPQFIARYERSMATR